MNCEKTRVFLGEYQRMHETYKGNCYDCPAHHLKIAWGYPDCYEGRFEVDPDVVIEIVQEWSDANPMKPSVWYVDRVQVYGIWRYFVIRDLDHERHEYRGGLFDSRIDAQRCADQLNWEEANCGEEEEHEKEML